MKKDNVIKDKSYAFAIRIVKLYKYLCEEKKEYTLSKQLLRCGTSIGPVIRESEHAESNADFIHKLSVSPKEANETDYWLNILKDTGYIELKLFQSLLNDNNEILKLLTSIIKTCKSK